MLTFPKKQSTEVKDFAIRSAAWQNPRAQNIKVDSVSYHVDNENWKVILSMLIDGDLVRQEFILDENLKKVLGIYQQKR